MSALSSSLGQSACATQAAPASSTLVDGPFRRHDPFPSQHIAARRIDVWLPTGYEASSQAHAVLYMHDGQNLFDPATSTHNQPWAVDKKLDALIAAQSVKPTIVVGIWNTAKRWQEYVPAPAIEGLPAATNALINPNNLPSLSEAYLRFIVTELKPFIDKTYRVSAARENTVIMGSSMGGLISVQALARYPQVFAGAGCLSTHWPITTNAAAMTMSDQSAVNQCAQGYIGWLGQTLPAAGKHRFYFDHGTINLDALYAPYQELVDVMMKSKGYLERRDYMSQVAEGADHNETAWRARLDDPLLHLLGNH
jgi:predicted alpha/beta superfamily hydrolase